MFGNMNNMQGMMKKMQKLQAELAKTQEDLKSRTVETVAGGGAIKVVASGKKELISLTIDPATFDPEDMEMLQDLIIVAVNDSFKKIDDLTESEMGKVTKGMKLPPGML